MVRKLDFSNFSIISPGTLDLLVATFWNCGILTLSYMGDHIGDYCIGVAKGDIRSYRILEVSALLELRNLGLAD